MISMHFCAISCASVFQILIPSLQDIRSAYLILSNLTRIRIHQRALSRNASLLSRTFTALGSIVGAIMIPLLFLKRTCWFTHLHVDLFFLDAILDGILLDRLPFLENSLTMLRIESGVFELFSHFCREFSGKDADGRRYLKQQTYSDNRFLRHSIAQQNICTCLQKRTSSFTSSFFVSSAFWTFSASFSFFASSMSSFLASSFLPSLFLWRLARQLG